MPSIIYKGAGRSKPGTGRASTMRASPADHSQYRGSKWQYEAPSLARVLESPREVQGGIQRPQEVTQAGTFFIREIRDYDVEAEQAKIARNDHSPLSGPRSSAMPVSMPEDLQRQTVRTSG